MEQPIHPTRAETPPPFGCGYAALWVHSHLDPARDVISLYYTNYLGYHLHEFGIRDFPQLAWWNLKNLLEDLGGLIAVGGGESFWGQMLWRVLTVVSLAGTIRLARKTRALQYPLFAAGSIAVLLLWHGPRHGRFLIALFPLLLAGFSLEFTHALEKLRGALRSSGALRSLLAGLAGGVLLLFAGFQMLLMVGATWRLLPGVVSSHRANLAALQPVYRWISENVPQDATFLTQQDPILYLRTGRRGFHHPISRMALYCNNREGLLAPYRSLPEIARQKSITHLLLTDGNFGELPAPIRREARQILCNNPQFELL